MPNWCRGNRATTLVALESAIESGLRGVLKGIRGCDSLEKISYRARIQTAGCPAAVTRCRLAAREWARALCNLRCVKVEELNHV